jgi:hypothetical protein
LLALTKDMVLRKKPFDKKGKGIWKGKSKTYITVKNNGRSQKKGYQCAFTIKMISSLFNFKNMLL